MVVVKKRTLIIISVLLACLFTSLFCFSALSETTLGSSLSNDIRIVLDAGHGGIDAGVTGVNTGVKESELNLLYVRKIEKLLVDAGFNVILTRNSDAGLYGIATKNLKRKDMQRRKEIIIDANPSLVISIHMNKYALKSRRGAQVFYNMNTKNGKVFANCVQTELNAMKDSPRNCLALSGDYYILNCSDVPSIIIECGFLSNADDEKNLISSDYQEEFTYTIFRGIISYFALVT